MIRTLRSQVSWEFLTLISVALVIFVIFGGIIANYTVYYHTQKINDDANLVLAYVNKEIGTAFQVHDGFYSNLGLPILIDGNNYTIVHNSSSIVLLVEGKNIKIISKSLTFFGNFNNSNKSNNFIFKNNSELYIN